MRDLAEGWREVRRHRWLTAGFLGYAMGNFGVGVYIVVGSLVAFDHLGGAPAWGLIVGSAAFGGVLGGFVAYRIRPSHPVSMAFAIWTLCALPPFALVRPFPLPVVMACALVFGGSILVGNTLFETAMQQEVAPGRLARVASIDLLLSLCLMPAGQLLAGSDLERGRRRRDAHPRRDADVRAELPRARARAGGAQRAPPGRGAGSGTGTGAFTPLAQAPAAPRG